MQIRRGNLEDIPSIARLLVKTWQKAYRDIFPSPFLDKLDTIQQENRHKRYIKDPKVTYLVIEEKNTLLGFLSYGPPRSDQMRSDNSIEIYAIYIDQAFQRLGYGNTLLKGMIERSTAQFIYVEVFKENSYFQFYTQRGFRPIDEGSIQLDDHKADYWICENQISTRTSPPSST